MTEEQAKALKVGDKVRYVGTEGFPKNIGNVYSISGIDSDGDPYVSHEDFYGNYYMYEEYLDEFEVVEPMPNYRIEIVSTSKDFDEIGMLHISAYVNDGLLAHLRDIEAEQEREAERNKIREQIAKLEAELEALK